MANYANPLPEHLRNSLFLLRDLTEAGINRSRVRRRDITKIAPGIYINTHARRSPTEPELAHALCRRFPALTLSGLSAARLYEFPLPASLRNWGPDSALSFATSASSAPDNPLVDAQCTSLAASETRLIECNFGTFPIVTEARAWLSIAHMLPIDYVVAIADYLIRKPRPTFSGGRSREFATLQELHELVARNSGRRGVARARKALAFVREGADSVQETRARLAFELAKLPQPRLNEPFYCADGRFISTPDFLWPEHGVVAEFDGSHHRDAEVFINDRDKDLAYSRINFATVRIYYSDLPRVRLKASDAQVFRELASCRAVELVRSALGRNC